ncbi:hypothetical protein AgCh_033247 [Apium graveolens]
MVFTLSAKNKLGFVDGSIVAPDVTADEFKFWERCKNLVISWLLANLDDAITKSVLFFHTVIEIWQNLDDRYGFSSMAQVYSLEQQLLEINQGTNSVSEFFTKIKTLWDGINDANPLPYCTCNACTCNLSQRKKDSRRSLLSLHKLNHCPFMQIEEDASLSVKNSDNLPQDQYNHLLNLINQKNGGPSKTDHDDNDHICPSIDQFITYRVVTKTDNTITIPDGKKIRVFHIRTVKLNDDIILKDVLHVPDF